MANTGRVTLPIQVGIDDEITELARRLGADAVRNSDGTELPEIAHQLVDKVYSTYFPARGDQDFALANPHTLVNQYLCSPRSTAPATGDLVIDVMEGYFRTQFAPKTDCDVKRWWQVIDRTTGQEVAADQWDTTPEGVVTIRNPQPFHVYTVGFLADQLWDSTQMYNYITNDWHLEPWRVKERPYDVRKAGVWEYAQDALKKWLRENPEVDVVRFTTFFYHFTLVFNDEAKEKYVDWFGYSASVSIEAMEAFEAEYGVALTAEDFVDEGYYNNAFRSPSERYLQWIDFQSRFVAERAKGLVDIAHAEGREAMMFLGDNWMGMEPYGKYFPRIGMDAVVGSVGSGATCRMISDIPGVKYTEGRFLPYFFPDVFNDEGDPVGEANSSWLQARRAIVRFPLDRMGYGGYPSLALKYPAFVDRMEEICNEFREIHELGGGQHPQNAPIRVAIVNAWGKLRTWQTYMVAHALWYKQIYTYLGIVEALSGLPFAVQFLSFDDVKAGALAEVDVLINGGVAGTAFSGGQAWLDAELTTAVRAFVAHGGGFIGVGEPAAVAHGGSFIQLSDVLGVDREQSLSLSTDRYPRIVDNHPLLADVAGTFDIGEGGGDVVNLDRNVEVLAYVDDSVRASLNQYGKGRGIYLGGLPYSFENARLLYRAIYWAAGREEELENGTAWLTDDVRTEVAYYPNTSRIVVLNNSADAVSTTVRGLGRTWQVELAPMGYQWLDI
ncbi:1,3-beta-galactosyl-N-acetylhexosamine phosphorylase [Buchananella hordeovulneris]|uniref:1,3-beta-galactosyl-N-acetylhexosamine phosphorylase n=1 Tax=Buchananella hordeovulneris TaxID=52770 RepID=UPI000F5FE25C|nr:1,3-beta-galactosyl-N-acetylhexosamine phosphorylase [Buchananella hordeovulneris]RRD44138.1 1,3-beta-galactosyl-N-acetylhexosamine phosphorylase [Buchananella hordeovulneris]